MAKLTDFTEGKQVEKATDSKLGLVKGGGDVHINNDGEMEIINNYGGPFKVSLSGTSVGIGGGRIHDGTGSQHTIILVQPDNSLTVTAGTTNAIWIEIEVDGEGSVSTDYVKTTSTTQAPTYSGSGTVFYILLANITYNEAGVAFIQQAHFGDIVINGISY